MKHHLDPSDPDLNEILGILIGDGWIGISGNPRKRKQVCFCGNLKKEVDYRGYIQRLIKDTLCVNGYYQERKDINTYYIIINSQGIFDFFQKNFDFPIGRKNKFNIDKLPKTWELQKRVIRGIFDTDGSVFFDRDPRYKVPYPVIDITLKNIEILDWIAENLSAQSFRTIRYGRQMRLKGRDNVAKWFKDISPKNDLHNKKYSTWLIEYVKGP